MQKKHASMPKSGLNDRYPLNYVDHMIKADNKDTY